MLFAAMLVKKLTVACERNPACSDKNENLQDTYFEVRSNLEEEWERASFN